MKDYSQPVKNIQAIYKKLDFNTKKVTKNEADELYTEMNIYIGTYIIITRNL